MVSAAAWVQYGSADIRLSGAPSSTHQRAPVRCDMDSLHMAGLGIGMLGGVGLGLGFHFVAQVAGKRDPCDMPLAVALNKVESMWSKVLSRCGCLTADHLRQQQISLASLRAKAGARHALDNECEFEDAWLAPVMQCLGSGDVLRHIDVDKDGMLDFREFSLIVLVHLLSTTCNGSSSEPRYLKSLHGIMDVDGDGRISKREFLAVCAVLRELGLLNSDRLADARRLDKIRAPSCTALKRSRSTRGSGEVLGKAVCYDFFLNAFSDYDTDDNGYLDVDEWLLLASKWADVGFLVIAGQ